MLASFTDYFELKDTESEGQPEKDSSLLEETLSSDESNLSDDSIPLTDADSVENDLQSEKDADWQENFEQASVADDTASYTASEQIESSGTYGEEKPPEEASQDTE